VADHRRRRLVRRRRAVRTDQTTYLDQIQSFGFNASLLNIVEHTYTTNGAGGNDYSENAFTGTAFQSSS